MRRLILLLGVLGLAACAGNGRRNDQPSLLTMASGEPRSAEQKVTRIDTAVLRFRIDPK